MCAAGAASLAAGPGLPLPPAGKGKKGSGRIGGLSGLVCGGDDVKQMLKSSGDGVLEKMLTESSNLNF